MWKAIGKKPRLRIEDTAVGSDAKNMTCCDETCVSLACHRHTAHLSWRLTDLGRVLVLCEKRFVRNDPRAALFCSVSCSVAAERSANCCRARFL